MMGQRHKKWLGHHYLSFENGTWYRHGNEIQAGCLYESDIFL